MKSKIKILIDLDVVTVAQWDSKSRNVELAREFIIKVENGEFYVGTPFLIIEMVLKWKHKALKRAIEEFYVRNSNKLFTDTEIKEKCDKLNVDYEYILNKFENAGIKREDAVLVLVASLFSFDYLITFNRVHLKNKKEDANKILKECKLPPIKIVGPEEI